MHAAAINLRGVRGVHRDARMVEPFVPKPNGPSGVPFIEMLEYGGTQASTSGRSSEVPFIEMLESITAGHPFSVRPSRVPFIEMLE